MLQVNLGLNFPGSGNKKEEQYCLAPALIEKARSPVPWCKALQRAAPVPGRCLRPFPKAEQTLSLLHSLSGSKEEASPFTPAQKSPTKCYGFPWILHLSCDRSIPCCSGCSRTMQNCPCQWQREGRRGLRTACCSRVKPPGSPACKS